MYIFSRVKRRVYDVCYFRCRSLKAKFHSPSFSGIIEACSERQDTPDRTCAIDTSERILCDYGRIHSSSLAAMLRKWMSLAIVVLLAICLSADAKKRGECHVILVARAGRRCSEKNRMTDIFITTFCTRMHNIHYINSARSRSVILFRL